MTVKDQDGNVVFSKTEDYIVNDFYVRDLDPKGKPEEVHLPQWRYDRQQHIHQGLEPKETKSYTFVAPLKEGTTSVDVEAAFRFIYEKDKETVWKKASKKVQF